MAYHGWDPGEADEKRSRSAGCASGMSPRAMRCSTATMKEDFLYHAAFSPDGRQLATAWSSVGRTPGRSQSMEALGLELGPRDGSRTIAPGRCRSPTTLAFSPDGRRLAGGLSSSWASPGSTSELRVWDAATGELVLTQRSRMGLIDAVAYNGDGTAAGRGRR